MKQWTLESLMAACNVTRYPARWDTFFDEVMADYDKNGFDYVRPAFYDEMNERFSGALSEHLEVFKQAAAEIGAREPLARCLALLCRAEDDRDTIMADLAEFTLPKDEEKSLAVRMLPALALCRGLFYVDNFMRKRGVPDEVRQRALLFPVKAVNGYRMRHNGEYGCFAFPWFQNAYSAKLYVIGSLQIELDFPSMDFFRVYENTAGEIITLANGFRVHKNGFALGSFRFEDEEGSFTATFEETADAYVGYPYDEKGYVCKEKVTLPKSEWHEKLVPGDPVVNLHIPSGMPFTPDALDETMKAIRAFLANCFPDYAYRAFVCGSWLLDPQLSDLLGPTSNIALFGKRFTPVCTKCDGYSVFRFAFLMPNNNFTFEELPESTRLHRAVKQHYLNGKAIYTMGGYFF